MRRLMTAARWREANGYYFGHGWRAIAVVAVAYVALRMI